MTSWPQHRCCGHSPFRAQKSLRVCRIQHNPGSLCYSEPWEVMTEFSHNTGPSVGNFQGTKENTQPPTQLKALSYILTSSTITYTFKMAVSSFYNTVTRHTPKIVCKANIKKHYFQQHGTDSTSNELRARQLSSSQASISRPLGSIPSHVAVRHCGLHFAQSSMSLACTYLCIAFRHSTLYSASWMATSAGGVNAAGTGAKAMRKESTR